jgi:hypothetical protein
MEVDESSIGCVELGHLSTIAGSLVVKFSSYYSNREYPVKILSKSIAVTSKFLVD